MSIPMRRLCKEIAILSTTVNELPNTLARIESRFDERGTARVAPNDERTDRTSAGL
jgi:hypothetical protein